MPSKKTKRTHTSVKKGKVSRKRITKKTKKKEMPVWLRNILVIAIVVLFTAVFYYFFIRPYMYRWKPCHTRKNYGVCLPYGYKIHGLDISHYQGDVDWHAVRQHRLTKHPLHFVFMKATEGGDHTDTTFVRNFKSAYEHGFIRGAYHFFSPYTDPVKQADFYIRTVDLKAGDLPPVLDIEVTGKKKKTELQDDLKVWLKKIEEHYGVKPIIYASYKFKMKYLNDSLFNTYPYWIAHYYVDSVRYRGDWHFWQHTDVGNVPGIKPEVDLNVFNGTLEELRQLTIKTP